MSGHRATETGIVPGALLGVIAFIAFWVVLAATVFFFAGRRPGGARRERQLTYRGSRALGATLIVLYIAFGVAVPVLLLHGNNANANAQVGGNKLTTAEKRGSLDFRLPLRLLPHAGRRQRHRQGRPQPRFAQTALRPDAQHDHQRLPTQPRLANSSQSCLGEGVMPAGIIQGRDATDVAQFVAKVAGRE